MKEIRVKTPAKINYTLEILNKRDDGFHNIKSIMQTISLYDYLTLKVEENSGITIIIEGNSKEIPYNEQNLAYKAALKFFETVKIMDCKLYIYIEKNIPVSSGLAGGSTNAAGVFYALNKLFDSPLNSKQLDELCSKIGSDLNFCLHGGCALCTSRGEIIEKLPVFEQSVSLIKPKILGISAKEAYTKFSQMKNKSFFDNSEKLKNLLINNKFDKNLLYNSFEKALFPYYKELQIIKDNVKGALMSGSGSTFFILSDKIETSLDKNDYDIFENLKTTNNGVCV